MPNANPRASSGTSTTAPSTEAVTRARRPDRTGTVDGTALRSSPVPAADADEEALIRPSHRTPATPDIRRDTQVLP
ncbi:hypothetical protein GCM10023347_47930 [Streptomyces chumphonensis]